MAHILASYGHGTGQVFNLGHGITRKSIRPMPVRSSRQCTNCRLSITADVAAPAGKALLFGAIAGLER